MQKLLANSLKELQYMLITSRRINLKCLQYSKIVPQNFEAVGAPNDITDIMQCVLHSIMHYSRYQFRHPLNFQHASNFNLLINASSKTLCHRLSTSLLPHRLQWHSYSTCTIRLSSVPNPENCLH